MPRAPRRSTEEVRGLIVDAAEKLFAERGYSQTTMRDVAGEAGIGLSVLYRQFDSKERLFAATFVGPFLASFEKFSVEQPVGDLIRNLHENLGDHRETIITLLGALDDPDSELLADVRETLGEPWRNLQTDAHMLVVAMVVGLVLFRPWVAAARDGDDEPLVALAAAFSAAGLRATAGAAGTGLQDPD